MLHPASFGLSFPKFIPFSHSCNQRWLAEQVTGANNLHASQQLLKAAAPAPHSARLSVLALDSSKDAFSVEGTVDGEWSVQHAAHMNAITYTAARENLASTMDRVCNDHSPVIITRNRDQSVVMLSLEDFEALEETAYLLRSPANAKRLLESIHSLENGQGITRSIDLHS